MKLFNTNSKHKNLNILINLAKINGLTDSEKEILYTIGERNDISKNDIDKMIEKSEDTSSETFDIVNKFDDLYDMVSLIAADGIVDEEELEYINKIKIDPSSGFNPKFLDLVIRKISYDILENVEKETTKINLEPFLI